ncbi:hypothetical protein MRB53_013398 [Persea americana]|uniref:Uncharacterized protein n=1 Tax=Persea americana TaxID=3435 RepID=A0ACC2K8A0_PERAE|nr:hypothetical protein MRB53_013398 [Persea americana]
MDDGDGDCLILTSLLLIDKCAGDGLQEEDPSCCLLKIDACSDSSKGVAGFASDWSFNGTDSFFSRLLRGMRFLESL